MIKPDPFLIVKIPSGVGAPPLVDGRGHGIGRNLRKPRERMAEIDATGPAVQSAFLPSVRSASNAIVGVEVFR